VALLRYAGPRKIMATIIDGKAVAQKVRSEVAAGVVQFQKEFGRVPSLHVVLAGEDPASAVYVRNKENAARQVGMDGHVHRLPVSVSQVELEALVRKLDADPLVDGILVQLPLPPGLTDKPILEMIRPEKDVDGFHAVNVGALWSGLDGLVPCTARGCLRLLQEAGVKLQGARALVIGRSNLVGKPVSALLLQQNATVTVAHSRSENLEQLCREADIIIAAVGKAKLVRGSWVKPGAAVIDVGTNRDEQGKQCGDVDFAAVAERAGFITPVPGGVGPMTVALLLENTLTAARARATQK
jgi:methylenetetrahydrofolate dehydrogenase (NADP+) / methenyltetrahydrofolate cyclohydrolase